MKKLKTIWNIHISTPKWKVREYTRLIIGLIMIMALMAAVIYFTMYGQWLRIRFLNNIFG